MKIFFSLLVVFIVAKVAMVGFNYKDDNYARSRAVKLVSDIGSCSGEQVRAPSGIDYILTAAHCKILSHQGSILAILEDGKRMERKVIAEDPDSDLLLLEGLPNLEGLKIADKEWHTQHVMTFTHGGGMSTYKTDGEIVQEYLVEIPLFALTAENLNECNLPKYKRFLEFQACVMSVQEIVMTAEVIPGSSGGMVLNDRYELVGVVSAQSPDFGLAVRLQDIQSFLYNY